MLGLPGGLGAIGHIDDATTEGARSSSIPGATSYGVHCSERISYSKNKQKTDQWLSNSLVQRICGNLRRNNPSDCLCSEI